MAKRAKPGTAGSKPASTAKKKSSEEPSPQKPVPYSVSKIESVAEALRGFASEIDGHADSMRKAEIAELMVREGMLKRSMGHLGDFCDQLKTKIRKAKGVEF